jgi:hypothetical protein
MSEQQDDDLALQTLLAVRAEVAPGLDEKLLRQCYQVQRKHQFSGERVVSSKAMEDLIDAVLTASDGVGG